MPTHTHTHTHTTYLTTKRQFNAAPLFGQS